MSATYRFPFSRDIPNVARTERPQIITLLGPTATIPLGGEQAYVDVRPWKTAGDRNTETPYACVAIEFSASRSMTLGDGATQMIGLYGQIDLVATPVNPAQRVRTLLAVLGLNLGNAMPQIPIVQQAGPALDLVGFTQLVSNVAIYDRLSIGGVFGDVAVPIEEETVTVTARPVRQRDYLG